VRRVLADGNVQSSAGRYRASVTGAITFVAVRYPERQPACERAHGPPSQTTRGAPLPEQQPNPGRHGPGKSVRTAARGQGHGRQARESDGREATDQGLSLDEAYTLCSIVGDLKISETVDLLNWLVSMTFPRGIFV
jgi:hypothetical protein